MTPFPYPIQTARLILRPFVATDLDDLFAYHSRPDVAQFLYWNARSRTETEHVIAQRMAPTSLMQDGARIVLAVLLPELNKVIGDVSLTLHSQAHRQGEIGFVFHPDYKGQGYATEATQALLAFGFTTWNLHRICGRCDARNTASYKLMERLGMRREAHFIHNEIFKGEWGDELVYAILQDEWQR